MAKSGGDYHLEASLREVTKASLKGSTDTPNPIAAAQKRVAALPRSCQESNVDAAGGDLREGGSLGIPTRGGGVF